MLRGLNQTAGAIIERLFAEPFFVNLIANRLVIKTTRLKPDSVKARLVAQEGWHTTIEHEPVDFITWPYEWPFSMLKDAALLQLHLLETSANNGWLLKDATPFNIQWFGVRPVFIDVPSFIPWEEGNYWRGYRQFCCMFLTPLLLTAHLSIPFQPLLRSRLDGIAPDEAIRYFYGLRRFKRGVLSHIWFPARAERRASKQYTELNNACIEPRRKQPKMLLLALLNSLRRLVSSLSWRPTRSLWSEYTENHSYDDADFHSKKDFVQRHISSYQPYLTWDLGANTGAFSRIAARDSQLVIAMDADHNAVNLLYHDLRSHGPSNIIPLVMDLANLSPAQGWAGCERQAFTGRRSPDLVLCLALIHHLRVAANVPLTLVLDWLRSLNAVVILEFVDRQDEMFQTLLMNKREDYSDYSTEHFHTEVRKRFSIRERLQLKDNLRVLFLLEPA